MITAYTKKLVIGIAIVSLLLVLCVATDSATTLNNEKDSQYNLSKDTILVNNSSYIALNGNDSYFVAKSTDKVYINKTTNKKKTPTITMTGKPSCGCKYSYTWHTRTYINYCPNCHHYNCLGNKHKYNARFEQEISCYNCDSDFCICCGKEKYSWSRVYLRRA